MQSRIAALRHDDQHRARLLMELLLVLLAGGLILTLLPALIFAPHNPLVNQEFLAFMIASVPLAAAYYLARHVNYKAGAVVTIVTVVAAIFIVAYPDEGFWQINYTAYLVIPVLLCSALLSPRAAALLLVVVTFGAVIMGSTFGVDRTLEYLIGPLTLVLLVSALVLRLAHYRDTLEAERSAAMVASETQRHEKETLAVALAKERELGNLKNLFMTTISHEFRTPLATIFSSAELLDRYRDRMTPERMAESLTTIRQQVQVLNGMLHDVTTLMQMQFEAKLLTLEPVDLEAWCDELLNEMRTHIAPSHRFIFKAFGTLTQVHVDHRLLRHILFNLLGNAAKYSPPGSTVRLEVEVTSGQMVLRVLDQGIGILQDDTEHLYEPFYRGKNAEHISGTGLGLKIVYDCVQLYGGTVSFTSQAGVGTCFQVTLPTLMR